MPTASASNSGKAAAEPTVQQCVQPWAVELNKLAKASSTPSESIWYLIQLCQLCLFMSLLSVQHLHLPRWLCTLQVLLSTLKFYLMEAFQANLLSFWCCGSIKLTQTQSFITFNIWWLRRAKLVQNASAPNVAHGRSWKPGTTRSLTLGFRDDKSWVGSQWNILR